MRLLRSKVIRILVLLIIVVTLLMQTNIIQNILSPERVEAVGDLTIDWGIGFGTVGPIFSVSNMAPGQSENRTVKVSNGGTSAVQVGIRGTKTNETGDLASALSVTVSRNGTDLYGGASATGPKTLANLLSESSSISGISLFNQPSGATSDYVITVKFIETAGNEFQNTSVTFAIHMGISVDIPIACEGIQFSSSAPIFGTSKSEKLNGTSGNDLILGMGGSDIIDGKSGQDCIIGAGGGDIIRGGDGNDVISGLGGNDILSGGKGDDTLMGNVGNDILNGESGNDTLLGNEGKDIAKGGTGTDSCQAKTMNSCEIKL